MLRILQSRRLPRLFTNKERPFCSKAPASNPNDAAVLSSAASLSASDQAPSSASTNPEAKRSSLLLKLGIFGALTGASVATGYATYAYTSEEVDEKTKAFRASTNYSAGENASTLEDFFSFQSFNSASLQGKTVKPSYSCKMHLFEAES